MIELAPTRIPRCGKITSYWFRIVDYIRQNLVHNNFQNIVESHLRLFIKKSNFTTGGTVTMNVADINSTQWTRLTLHSTESNST